MFKLVLQTVKKQEKSQNLTVEVIKLHCVSNCFSPDWPLWQNRLISGFSSLGQQS